MTNDFTTLDLSTLDLVIGGNDAPGGEQVDLNLGVSGDKNRAQLGLQVKSAVSDYAKCVNTVAHMPGTTPADIRSTCGLPPPK